MNYELTGSGIFISRPNRFLARVQVGETEVISHVPNTGRLGEILIPGASVVLAHHPDFSRTGRKTEYSLIAVYKEKAGFREERLLINLDSQAPNAAAEEWLKSGGLDPRVTDVRREVRFGESRIDLAFSLAGRPCLMEVKGVTLEDHGAASFPDAPTERGIRHIRELQKAAAAGFGAYLLFVIQMKGICAFSPNRKRHPEFADALKKAAASGVHVLACDCLVTETSLVPDRMIPVLL